MKKGLIVVVGLLLPMAIGVVGCKSNKERVYEQQIEAVRKIFVANGLNADEERKYGIGTNSKTGEIELLHLNGRNLTVLPPEIGLLTGLEELDLRNNQLTELPEEIGNLKKLKKLNVSMNRLEILPHRIGDLVELLEFDIGENQLERLPESIGNLVNLTRFAFDRNNLNDLPETMGNMKKLSYIASQNNKFKLFPRALGLLPPGKSFPLSEGFDTTTIPPNVKHETGDTYVVTH